MPQIATRVDTGDGGDAVAIQHDTQEVWVQRERVHVAHAVVGQNEGAQTQRRPEVCGLDEHVVRGVEVEQVRHVLKDGEIREAVVGHVQVLDVGKPLKRLDMRECEVWNRQPEECVLSPTCRHAKVAKTFHNVLFNQFLRECAIESEWC